MLLPSQVTDSTKSCLNKEHTGRDTGLERDSIFIIEKILKKKNVGKATKYLIKWENYHQTTWEPQENIPKIFKEYFERTGKQDIPTPRIKHTKKIGNTQYHLLTWDDGSVTWAEDSEFQFAGSIEAEATEPFSCQTRKDKDKRLCRHTWGVLIGCYPCGVVVLFDELFGSGMFVVSTDIL